MKYRGIAVFGNRQWLDYVQLVPLLPTLNIKIIDVLAPIDFIDSNNGFVATDRAVLNIPYFKRNSAIKIIAQYRQESELKVQDLIDSLRVLLGDGFFFRHELKYLDQSCFNIVLGLQTPHELEMARTMGLKLLCWRTAQSQSKWEETDITFQRVLFDKILWSKRPAYELQDELYSIVVSLASTYKDLNLAIGGIKTASASSTSTTNKTERSTKVVPSSVSESLNESIAELVPRVVKATPQSPIIKPNGKSESVLMTEQELKEMQDKDAKAT